MSIGIFDSGVGGLSVWSEVRAVLPSSGTVYFADQANFPYGVRTPENLKTLSEAALQCLLNFGAEVIVIACNTASAAALKHLRTTYPKVPIVGMEPAIKPAVALSRSGVVAVLATAVTLEGNLLEQVVDRFARDVRVFRQPCQRLVECVESGGMGTPEARQLLVDYIGPCLLAGADTIVLGCTHYSFLKEDIEEMYPQLTVVDPARAVARQVKNVLALLDSGQSMLASSCSSKTTSPVIGHTLITSGPVGDFQLKVENLFGKGQLEGVAFSCLDGGSFHG